MQVLHLPGVGSEKARLTWVGAWASVKVFQIGVASEIVAPPYEGNMITYMASEQESRMQGDRVMSQSVRNPWDLIGGLN